ncbi:MAG TPA: ATP-binding protein [Alphaproteobacteria bacterium]|nr:ATP-binding protein [Alphaproteobacteria bacterium]HQS94314.1 ATP-binding protein [Alphaproteobacteria bacterium]
MLNFERNPELQDFFINKTPKKIIEDLSIYSKKKLDPHATILFLDEIQAAPQVLEVLRYFYEEYPEFPVIAAGSLLDFVLEEPEFSMPVGRIEYFYMGPLSFEDFLIALGENNLVQWIKTVSVKDTIPLPIHQQCIDLVKQFWLIGGMPAVVAHFAQYRDFQEIDNIKQNILQTYQDDFHKYGRIKQFPLLRQVFNSIPRLVGQKIKYSNIDPHSKSLQVRESLDALNLARVIHLVHHTQANGIPLGAQADARIFKAIFLDIGLQCASLGLNQLEIIKGPDWAWINRGSLAEQFVGQALLKLSPSYHPPQLFYWVRENAYAKAEVDYVIQMQNHLIPIEVKPGKTGTLKSLHYFMREKERHFAVRFNADVPSSLQDTVELTNKQSSISYKLLSLPFYLAEQLGRLSKAEEE